MEQFKITLPGPQIVDIDGSPTLITPSKRERDALQGQILDKLKLQTESGWSIKPKRWKYGGHTYYGIMLELKL